MRPTASLALLAVVLALAPSARAATWRRPVAGPVAHAFAYGPDPFRRGWHRGVDFGAPPGAAVRAACSGTVVTARPVAAAGGVVTLRCGRWRVTHMPLASIGVRPGAFVAAGERIGTLGSSRASTGLHLGVRRAGDRFGYVDPLRFLSDDDHAAPPIAVVPGGRDLGPTPRPALPEPVRTGPTHTAAPAAAASRPALPARAPAAAGPLQPATGAHPRPLAPWPAWAGLGLALCGAVGGGFELRRRGARTWPAPRPRGASVSAAMEVQTLRD